MLNISMLEKCIEGAKTSKSLYFAIAVEGKGFVKKEIIINSIDNADVKMKYYKVAYNDDLTSRAAPDKIKIVGFTFGNTFEEIEKDLG